MPRVARPVRTVLATAAVAASALAGVALAPAPATAAAQDPRLRDVMWVGNNWDGTASVVDARSHEVLLRDVDLIPDKAQEIRDIWTNPVRLAMFMAIRMGPGEGNDQYVDDMFTTTDGRYLAISRPSFGDVIWLDVAKATRGEPGAIVREQSMDGFRSDHMALSEDGRRLLVSDSTERQVIEYSMVDEVVGGQQVRMGDRLRRFESGETPHENNYSGDDARIYHASIGRVYTPGDGTEPLDALFDPVTDPVKGDRWLQVVRNDDFRVLKRWEIGHELAEAGHPHMSSAVRPMAITSDERFLYFQVSFFHGYVEFDTRAPDLNGTVDYTLGEDQPVAEPRTGAVTRVVPLPKHTDAPRDLYVNDSAHHGLSLDRRDTTLCVAGTMDDYAALVDRETGEAQIFDEATTGRPFGKPYWTTEGLSDTCWISLSESDALAVLDVRRRELVAYLDVGNHPQRVRHGYVPERLVRSW